MSVNANDFRVAAEQNYNFETEIGYRNCVSRAYYSMYHNVLELITQEIPRYSQKGVHACLLTYLAEGSADEPYEPKELRKLSYVLQQQKSNRSKADYDLDSDKVGKLMAEDSIAACGKVAQICVDLAKAA